MMSFPAHEAIGEWTRSLLLDGKRSIGYAIRGAQKGTPILVCHSMPGCRLSSLGSTEDLVQRGLLAVTPDRPGYGLSDPVKHATPSQWCADADHLLRHLGLDRLHVIGLSGGAAYALACAAAWPQRVLSVTLVSPIAPPELIGRSAHHAGGTAIGYWLGRFAPFLLRWGADSFASTLKNQPALALRQLMQQVGEGDTHGLNDQQLLQAHAGTLSQLQEAFRQGGAGHAADMRLVYRPWRLEFGRIAAPVHVWQGELDQTTPPEITKQWITHLPHARLRMVQGRGHTLLDEHAFTLELLSDLAKRS